MAHWLERSELLVGTTNLEKLNKAHVLIVGLGGIGSFAAEFIFPLRSFDPYSILHT